MQCCWQDHLPTLFRLDPARSFAGFCGDIPQLPGELHMDISSNLQQISKAAQLLTAALHRWHVRNNTANIVMVHARTHACDSPIQSEDFDVYAHPEPLEAGQEKHTISVFVADEAGLINRVAGVFARRGGQPDGASNVKMACGHPCLLPVWQQL